MSRTRFSLVSCVALLLTHSSFGYRFELDLASCHPHLSAPILVVSDSLTVSNDSRSLMELASHLVQMHFDFLRLIEEILRHKLY